MSTPAGGGKRSWRGGERESEKAIASGRKRTIYILVGMMAILVGSFGAWLAMFNPFEAPYLISMAVPGYIAYPPIPFVDQDVETIKGLWEQKTLLTPGGQMAVDKASQNLVLLKNKLESELDKNKTDPKRPLVMILIAYARLVNGKVIILASDSTPSSPEIGLPLREILLKLKANPAEKKLLILDLMRPLREARLGVLRADIGQYVKEEIDATPDENRMVFTACAPGQISHVGEELNRSVFGYYLERGLKGAADGWNPNQTVDERVSARELYNYVAFHVHRYVQQCRADVQTPLLLSSDTSDKLDFPIRATPKSSRQIDAPSIVSGDFPIQAWQALDSYRTKDVDRELPTAFGRWQREVLQTEHRWRCGEDLARLEKTILQPLPGQFQAQLNEYLRNMAPPEARSLAQEMARASKAVDRSALTAWSNVMRQVDPEKPIADDVKKNLNELLAPFKESPVERINFLFTALVEEAEPTLARLRLYLQFISPIDQPPPKPYIETLFLKQLTELKREPWPTSTIRLALRCLRDGERLLAGDYRTWSWLHSMIQATDQMRHEAEWLLFVPGYATIEDVNRAYQTCSEELTRTQTAMEQLSRAFAVRDEGLLILPYFGQFLAALTPSGEADAFEALWTQALQTAGELENQVNLADTTNTEGVSRRITRLAATANTLQSQLRVLRDRLEGKKLEEFMNLAKQNRTPADWATATAMLEWPFYPAAIRKQLWDARLDLAKRLRDVVDQQDVEDDKQPLFKSPPTPIASTPRDDVRASWIVRLSIKQLRLAGAEGTSKLQELLAQTTEKPELWEVLSEQLEKEWVSQLPQQVLKREGTARDRLLKMLDFSFTKVDSSALDALCPQDRKTMELARQHWIGENDTYLSMEWNEWPALAEFLELKARRYRGANAMQPPMMRVESGEGPIELRRGDRSEVQLSISGNSRAQVFPLSTDPVWLSVEVPTVSGDPAATSFTQPIVVRRKAGAENQGSPPPQGFVVVARFQDRSRHLKLATILPPSTANRPRIVVTFQPKDDSDPVDQLRIRPNIATPLFTFIRNPSGKDLDLSIELWDGDRPIPNAKKDISVGAQEKIKKVEWDAPMIPVDKWPVVRGELIIKLRDKKQPASEPLDERKIPVHVMAPWEYLKLDQATYYPGARPKFELILRSLQNMNPPCKVEVHLIADNTITKQGVLTTEMPTLTLPIEGLRFKRGEVPIGRFVVHADGYARAFRGDFTVRDVQSDAALDQTAMLGIRLPKYTVMGKAVPLSMEADFVNNHQVIELSIGRSPKGPFDVIPPIRFIGGRDMTLKISPGSGETGGLLIYPQVQDHMRNLNLPEGDRELFVRCRILDQQGLELADFEPVIHKIVQVDQSPIITKIAGLELQEDQLTVLVEGNDPNAPIEKVQLFAGQPTEDGKKPERVRTVDMQYDDTRKGWIARIRLEEPDRKSVYVTAMITNSAGLVQLKPNLIDLESFRKKTMVETTSSLTGTVVLDNRGQLGETVTLIDAKGGTHTTKTKAGGAFSFEGLPPGPCRISCFKLGTAFSKTTTTVLQPGKNGPVTLELSLN